MTVDTLTIALAQPRPYAEPDGVRNVIASVETVAQAAAAGAALVLFPEGYPGPIRTTARYDAAPQLAAVAAREQIAVCWSRVEAGAGGRFQTVAYVHGADGAQVLRHVRSHPATGDVHQLLNGSPMAPGPRIAPTFTVGGVCCGLLVCSELWLPEIARVLALAGAELLLTPAGGGFGPVAANWRLIARARAIENQAHVALTQNLFGSEAGSALVGGPEGEVARRTEEGLLVATLDLARARRLQAEDDSMVEPKPFRSLPGLLRARRPALYHRLAEPVEGLYDYEAAAAPLRVFR